MNPKDNQLYPYRSIEDALNNIVNQHNGIIEAAIEAEKAAKENITMTRKDFIEIADTLKMMEHVPEEYRRQMALSFIHLFQQKNPNFDECRFMKACGFKND